MASLWFSKRAVYSEKEVFQFLSEMMCEKIDAEKSMKRARGLLCDSDHYALRQVSALEQQIYMHDPLLRDTDAMSMAHSLEVRLPLISKEIVETVAQISPTWLWKGGPKWVLKDWLAQNGFQGFFDRPKQGFTLNW
jgi:asparagine synthetase B (glutamine-hydrolysing)